MTGNDDSDRRQSTDFTFIGDVGEVVVDLGDEDSGQDLEAEQEEPAEHLDGESRDVYWPGGDDPDEPELSRVGRVAIGFWIDRHASRIHQRANLITERALDGEDITRADITRLQAAMEEIQDILNYYAIPVVEERESKEVDDD